MDIFAIADGAGGAFLQAAAIAAAYELGVFAALALPRTFEDLAAQLDVQRGRDRLRALVDVLVATGAITHEGSLLARGQVPMRPQVPREGWGLLAEVIRRDHALVHAPASRAYHDHLRRAGADAARELAPWLRSPLLDLGGGAGAYTSALLVADPSARATLVDVEAVLELAREQLASFGDRAVVIAGDARAVTIGEPHACALLSNVLHGHGREACAQLVAAAARSVRPGGSVVIKDLRVDDGRAGPLSGLLFALNMAVYTDAGSVYETSQLRTWLAEAGLVGIEERTLASAPDAIVVIGYRPRGATAAFEEIAGAVAPTARLSAELELPAPLRCVLEHALTVDDNADMRTHYTALMPQMRRDQLASSDALLHTPLEWGRLPRLRAAIGRLRSVLVGAGVDPALFLGDVERASTVATLYTRTHYGGAMPLLYGCPADLAYFHAQGAARGLDTLGTIDRYLTTPVIHELCHGARDRDALQPLHLDECVAGWLGVYVHPEFAYPAPGEDDAIYASPWLAQIGQAIARAFGRDAVIRAHAGGELWDAAVPKAFVDTAARLGWADWLDRRTLHFLSDTLDPAPWIALALAAGAGRPLGEHTLSTLASLPLSSLANALPPDPDGDRAIVVDALRAMCLDNAIIDGSCRARTRLPQHPITIDAVRCRVTTPARGGLDHVDPSYWIPPAVGARLATAHAQLELTLPSLEAIPEIAAALCDGRSTLEARWRASSS